MALGPTHFNWRSDVAGIVRRLLDDFPDLTANTYEGHPWPGWDRLSVDIWGPGGRGDAIPERLAWPVARYLMRQPGRPLIRHVIIEHSLWTSWGGWSFWSARDHSGELRHVHVTYWPHAPGTTPN